MTNRFEKLMSALLTMAAVFIAIAVVRKDVFPARPSVPDWQRPEFITDWKTIISTVGRDLGPSKGPVQLVEFVDLECPYCREYNSSITAVLEKFPNEVNLIYVHYPLRGHKFAKPAARAVECAGAQGRFLPMVNSVFAKQDSFGLKAWTSYALEAGVRDTSHFRRCNADTIAIASVEGGVEVAKSLGVRGTPSLMLNGWLLRTAPTEETLIRGVKAIIASKQPYKESRKPLTN